MRIIIKSIVIILIVFLVTIKAVFPQAKLVHNKIQEIAASLGKLELELIRTWGGENEDDEHKFFDTPVDMVIDNENRVYISDQSDNWIKVFDKTGRYLRTIGQRGRGPGDLLAPTDIAFHPESGLWVAEYMGRRIQCFDIDGKSIAIFKTDYFFAWIGINSKNEIAIQNKADSIKSKRLLTIRNESWELKREIGVYHDKSKSTVTGENIQFAIDSEDNFIAANVKTPVIRKYSSDGKLLMAITYDTPFDLPFKISLNSQGDEIERTGNYEEQTVKIIKKGSGAKFQAGSGKARPKPSTCMALATDSRNRIYITTLKRMLTDEERSGGGILSAGGKILRSKMNFSVLENKDLIRLLVFSPEGKIIAQTKITDLFPQLYIHGDRIFLIDGIYNQEIKEYKMVFKSGELNEGR